MPEEYCCMQTRCEMRRSLEDIYGDADSYCEKYGDVDDIGKAVCPFAELLALDKTMRDMDDIYSKQFEQ